jgi:hypothetical protein
MSTRYGNSTNDRQPRTQSFKEAVIAVFCGSDDAATLHLSAFEERDWQKGLFWLDASGLTLYLIDRLSTLGRKDILPSSIRARLQQNLVDNKQRSDALFSEMVAINRDFHQASIVFTNLKGITLSPESVPDPALRCQLDLDFLVAADHATAARHVLENMGYMLDAVSGDTWEFKTSASGIPNLKTLYKLKPQRSAELHLLHRHQKLDIEQDTQLDRRVHCSFNGESLSTLSPIDLFQNQAHHLFKHICSAFTRVSWILEYRCHVLSRYNDAVFWETLHRNSKNDPQTTFAIGVVTLVATEIFGDFAPSNLGKWTIDQMASPVRLWIKTYSRRAMLADFPGTKLYLFLQSELSSENSREKVVLRKHLLPFRSPRMISHSERGERLIPKLGRYHLQLKFFIFRLRFHLIEGIRYMLELPRWRWRMTGLIS